MKLQPADILIVRGSGWISDTIRKLTRSPGEGRGWASHVALAVWDQHVVEAIPPRVVMRPMPYARGPKLQVWRPLNLTEGDRAIVCREAVTYVGQPYGFSKLALHALGLSRFAVLDGYPICSWVVASSYTRAGFTFGIDPSRADPDHIHDYCRSHAEKYRRIL